MTRRHGLWLTWLIAGITAGSLQSASAAPPISQAAPIPAPLAGDWAGALSVGGGMSLHVVFHFVTDAQGKVSATLTSPDQGPAIIPVAQVTTQGATVACDVPSIKGSFSGTRSGDGTQIVGQWTQGGSTLPLTLTRTNNAPVFHRPDEPQPPFSYLSRDVTFADPSAPGVTLAGTLTLPNGTGPFPAVVLIAGSGPQTRDENIYGHRLFFVLADYLTRQGIAVLRYDKRGLGSSTGSYASATTTDFANDAAAAVNYLKRTPSVDVRQIGLVGHSEGGLIAPQVANRMPGIAFVVLMAGPGLPGRQILLEQAALIGKAEGASDAQVARNTKLQKQMFRIILADADTHLAQTQLHVLLTAYVQQLPVADRKSLGDQAAFIRMQAQTATPWFRSFLSSNPIPALKRLKCPVLALNGSHDLQVPPKEDLAAIGAALRAGNNPDYAIEELPNLDHLFQTSRTGSPADYASSPETISPLALRTICDWIGAHTHMKMTDAP